MHTMRSLVLTHCMLDSGINFTDSASTEALIRVPFVRKLML